MTVGNEKLRMVERCFLVTNPLVSQGQQEGFQVCLFRVVVHQDIERRNF